jgi:hypothetical protein
MSVLTPESAVTPTPDAASLVGCRVFGPEGWIGTVTEAYCDDWLLVRTGLFRRRWLTVPAADIACVEATAQAVTLHRDPREFVASRLTGEREAGR